MPRKATKLPTGVQRHGSGYRIWYLYNGKRLWEQCGSDAREAGRIRAKRVRDIAEGVFRPDGLHSGATLQAFFGSWIADRRQAGLVRSVEDEARWMERHVLPVLGDKRLSELRPVDVREWVMGLRNGDLSPKSIRNAHGVLSTMLDAARFRELIVSNPAHRLPKGTLPTIAKRKRPPFARDETERLMGDDRIELERRVLYTMLCLAGLRLGEACGRRWRDIDTTAQPLHCMTVASQYEGDPLKTAKDAHDARRQVPVHPELARILAAWKLSGWAAAFGRHPSSEDFIVPDPRSMGARTKNQALKGLYRDCEAIGIPKQGTHAGRRFFITHARMDGARSDVLERVTHNAAGEQIDEYTYWGWETLCEAVVCLRVNLGRGEVVTLRASEGGG